ncbi:MAG TPA: hypothetical protein VHR55_12870 [Candidatus Limnocylindria bacterium]|nr:hypothetical protein [Candidatus Limnocylindria bacterium]
MIGRSFLAIAPAALAATFVLRGFVANAVPLDLLWRPLAVSVAIAIVIQVILVRAFGWTRGHVWAFVAVSVLTGLFVLAGAALLALTLFSVVRSGPDREYQLTGILAAAVSGLLFVAVVSQGVAAGAFDWQPILVTATPMTLADDSPSLHVLLLDGYPRQDVLEANGVDNEPFLAVMEVMGFDVYRDSRSNYTRTPFSVLSILSARHIDEMSELWADVPSGAAAQQRLVARALLAPPMLEWFRAAGYATRVLPATVAHVPLGGADEARGAGTANNFELDLLQRTPLAAPLEVIGFAAGQQRTHIERTLDTWADPPSGRTFTFAHVMSPHAPFVFRSDGSPADAPPCYPATCSLFDSDVGDLGWPADEYVRRWTGQVEHLNTLVLAAVERLVAEDPGAVVLVVSDHGVRGPAEDVQHRNLILARVPGHRGVLGTSPTLVNVIVDAMAPWAEGTVPRASDMLYRSGDDPWLFVEPLPSSAADGP